jgi:hypothetical protein
VQYLLENGADILKGDEVFLVLHGLNSFRNFLRRKVSQLCTGHAACAKFPSHNCSFQMEQIRTVPEKM